MKEFLRGVLAVVSFVAAPAGIAWIIIGVAGDSHHHKHPWAIVIGVIVLVLSAISIFTVSWPFYKTRAWAWFVFGYTVFMTAVLLLGLAAALIDRDWRQAPVMLGGLIMIGMNGMRFSWRKLKESRP